MRLEERAELARDRVGGLDAGGVPGARNDHQPRAVDGAPAGSVGWWVNAPVPALERSLAALGATFDYHPYPPLGGAYVGFGVPPLPLRELAPDTLRATASESAARAVWILDRQLLGDARAQVPRMLARAERRTGFEPATSSLGSSRTPNGR